MLIAMDAKSLLQNLAIWVKTHRMEMIPYPSEQKELETQWVCGTANQILKFADQGMDLLGFAGNLIWDHGVHHCLVKGTLRGKAFSGFFSGRSLEEGTLRVL